MIYTIYFKKKVKLKLTCSIVFLARFLLNSWYYPVFKIVIEQEKMRVFKQRAIFNLMHAVFLLLSELQKPDNNTNLTKT